MTRGSGELMVRLKACWAMLPAPSLTCTVNVLVSTLVGVPVISVDCTPKNLSIFKPNGSLPLTTRHVKGVGPEPPLAVVGGYAAREHVLAGVLIAAAA